MGLEGRAKASHRAGARGGESDSFVWVQVLVRISQPSSMAGLLQGQLALEPSQHEPAAIRARSVQPRRYLTDANISDIYRTLGSALPASVLLLTPAQSHMIAMAAVQDSRQEIANLGWEIQDVVIVPVNDATLRTGNQGRHWKSRQA